MTLNNVYHIEKKLIKELLDDVDKFTTNISKFTNKHKGYNYSVEITNNKLDKDFFDAKITIKHEKQNNVKNLQEIS